MMEINELNQAIDDKILELLPAAIEKIVNPTFMSLFRMINDGHAVFRSEAMHAAGRFKQFANGTPIMEEQAFEGGLVQITAVPLGAKKSWTRSIAEKMVAEGWDLPNLVDNWVQAYGSTRDIQAAAMIQGNTATGYDGVTLFSASHPQRSKFNTGTLMSNTNATALKLTSDTLDSMLTQHEDLIAYGENGEPIDNYATHLVGTTRSDWTNFKVLLKSELKADNANHGINPELNAYVPVMWRRLKNTVSGQTEYAYSVTAAQGLLYVERMGFMQEVWYDPNTKAVNASASFEGGPGWNNWRSIYRQALDRT